MLEQGGPSVATQIESGSFKQFGPSILPGAARKRAVRFDLVPDRESARDEVRKTVPMVPGVYGWLDDRGQLVYVGKSKSLRTRLVSYFAKSPHDDKMLRIRQRGRSIVFEPICHELLALIREQELIDRWRPVYNSEGQPDKRRPAFLCISNDSVPKAFLSRDASVDSQRIYGPIIGTSDLRDAITSLNYVFQLRDCSDKTKMRFGNQLQLFDDTYSAGCLRFELSSCPAPCAASCTVQEYSANVDSAIEFLEGNDTDTVIRLEREMKRASGNLAFERAVVLRNQWKQMQWLQRRFKQLRQSKSQLHGVIKFRGFHNRHIWLVLKEACIEICLDDRDLKPGKLKVPMEIEPPTFEFMPKSPLHVNWQILLVRWFKKHSHEIARISNSFETIKEQVMVHQSA